MVAFDRTPRLSMFSRIQPAVGFDLRTGRCRRSSLVSRGDHGLLIAGFAKTRFSGVVGRNDQMRGAVGAVERDGLPRMRFATVTVDSRF